MAGNSFNIPHVISSESVEGLRELMLRTNLEARKEFVYYQIVFDGRRFHAFYMNTSDESALLKKKKPATKPQE